jgi:hypothetical protein
MFKRDNNSNSGSDNDTAPLMARNAKNTSSGASDDPFHAVREYAARPDPVSLSQLSFS